MLTVVDEYTEFCRHVKTRTGLDLTAYKRGQMERRIRALVERTGVQTLDAYWQILARNDDALHVFLDRVTINVSEFYRNPEKFVELREHYLPTLLRQGGTPFNIWSAGCSFGAEAYTLASIMEDHFPQTRYHVWATDVDLGVLAKARQWRYGPEDVRNVPSETLGRHQARDGDNWRVAPPKRRSVEFARHDLLTDPFPHGVDLILCRNVVIYFTDETKARLFTRFTAALRPGGVLLIGSTERIANAAALGLSSPHPFFYRKEASATHR